MLRQNKIEHTRVKFPPSELTCYAHVTDILAAKLHRQRRGIGTTLQCVKIVNELKPFNMSRTI